MVMPLPRTDDPPAAPAIPRQRKPPQMLARPVPRTLGVTLGIKRVEVVYERLGPLGSVQQRLGDNSSISLSGGDGSDFSVGGGWNANRLSSAASAGHRRAAPSGGSMAAPIAANTIGSMASSRQPTGRVMVLWAAINHKGRPVAPRLDLLGG